MKNPQQVWRASDGSIHECLGDANRAEAAVVAVNKIAEILEAQEEVIVNSRDAKRLAKWLVHEDGGQEIAKLLREVAEA